MSDEDEEQEIQPVKRRHPHQKHLNPPTLTQEVIDDVLEALMDGAYLETAAAYAGVPKATFFRWMQEARDAPPDSILVQFRESIHQVLAASEIQDLRKIKRAANKDWYAAAWRLERRFPKKWGKQAQIEVNIPGENKDAKLALKKLAEDPKFAEAIENIENQIREQNGESK